MNILLIVLVIHYLGYILTKNKINTLACGLFGWVGSDPKLFNKEKFDKLGIFNIKRGEHSCGIAVDGELYKGVNKTANFANFLVDDQYPSPEKVPVVIGHTRHATSGARNLKNAHPFRFDTDEGYFIGAHNGSLTNDSALASKYNIKDKHDKIDSQILLEIISTGKTKVLQEYKGAAALLIYSSIKENTMYIFKGASKKYYSSNKMEEERPLFLYQENDNSMYISSLENSLKAITNNFEEKEDSIFQVEDNKIYEITNGKLVAKHIIDRTKIWDDFMNSSYNSKKNKKEDTNSTNSRVRQLPSNTSSQIDIEKDNNIFYEKVIFTELEQDIYFENFRYKRNGHLVNSVCVFIKEVGLIRLCKEVKDIKSSLEKFSYFDKEIDFDIDFDDIQKTKLYFIYNGVMLKDKLDYETCLLRGDSFNFQDLSQMSEYPIINFKNKYSSTIKKKDQNILLNNKLYSGAFQPIGSFAEYTCKDGILTKKEELDDLIIPDSNDIISIYDNLDNVQIIENDSDDEDVFNDEITEAILDMDDTQLAESIIDSTIEIEESLRNLLYLKSKVKDAYLIEMLVEFAETSLQRLEPISEAVEKIADKINYKYSS